MASAEMPSKQPSSFDGILGSFCEAAFPKGDGNERSEEPDGAAARVVTVGALKEGRVVRLVEECFAAYRDERARRAKDLLESIATRPSSKVIALHHSPSSEQRAEYQYAQQLAFIEREFVGCALGHLCDMTPSLVEELGKLYIAEKSSPEKLEILTKTYLFCRQELPSDIPVRALELAMLVIESPPNCVNLGTSFPYLARLACRRSELSDREALRVLRGACFVKRDQFVEDFDFPMLQSLGRQLTLRFPQIMGRICCAAIMNPDCLPEITSFACELVGLGRSSMLDVSDERIEELLAHESPVVRSSSVMLCGALEGRGASFVPRLMELSQSSAFECMAAFRALGRLGRVPHLTPMIEHFFAYEFVDLLEVVHEQGERDGSLGSSELIDTTLVSPELAELQMNYMTSGEVPSGMRLGACLEGIGLLASQSHKMRSLLLTAAEVSSPLARWYLHQALPQDGDLALYRNLFDAIIETTTAGDVGVVVRLMCERFPDDGAALAHRWMGISTLDATTGPRLDAEQRQALAQALAEHQRHKALLRF